MTCAVIVKMAAIIVHAGAAAHKTVLQREGCEKAAQEAYKLLIEGKSALDAGN